MSDGTRSIRRRSRTIRYETSVDHVATITLDRPEVLNAFDRQMCHEVRDAWRLVKDDPGVHAVVLRAAGDRAFCAGLDTKKPYGQPDDIWNHEDPGELLSPKWQKVWKPVVCAVQGMCTAGAFYFLNESDIVICSAEATFFDSHVTYGLVSALEPVGLDAPGRPGPYAAHGADRERRAGHGADGAAHRPGHRGGRARRRCGSVPTSWPPASPRFPVAATEGTVRAIWESLDRPYRAAMEQGLIYTRVGNPIGMAEVAEHPPARREPRLR